MVQQLATLGEFQQKVTGRTDNVLVAIDFTATWCGPCKMIGPYFAELSGQNGDAEFYKVDVDENEEAAAEAGISAMPTFKFYKAGKQVGELVGASKEKLLEKLMECKGI